MISGGEKSKVRGENGDIQKKEENILEGCSETIEILSKSISCHIGISVAAWLLGFLGT